MNHEIPRDTDEAYADYVISIGSQAGLNHSQMQRISSAISRAVARSRRYIINPYTVNAIELTIIYALHHSVTLQNIVAFNLHMLEHPVEEGNIQVEDIGRILYQNRYEPNPDSTIITEYREIFNLNAADIRNANAQTVPIIPIQEAAEIPNSEESDSDESSMTPCVWIGAAPLAESRHYHFWQEALMHEFIHHVSGASDPDGYVGLGPTEILARQVATEMNWAIPSFNSYSDPVRSAAIDERNFAALQQTIERSPRETTSIMQRLARIANDHDCPENFSDIGEQSSSEATLTLPDFNTGDGSNGGWLSFIPGVFSAKPNKKSWSFKSRTESKNNYVMFDNKQYLTQRDLETLNLIIADMAVNRAREGSGFYKKDYVSWKDWYHNHSWNPPTKNGIFNHALSEAQGNIIYNPYGLKFNDGSFLVGITSSDIDKEKRDNWTTIAGDNWKGEYAGQMFFDKNGRPVAIAITNDFKGFFGSGWSFVYASGKWEYESNNDWDERRFSDKSESLDQHAARFLIE